MKRKWWLFLVVAAVVCLGIEGFCGQPEPVIGSQSPAREYVAGEVLVRLRGNLDQVQSDRLAADFGMRAVDRIVTVNLHRMLIRDGADERETARQVALDPRVLYAEPNFIDRVLATAVAADVPTAVPNDPRYAQQWHYDLINMPDAWDLTTGAGSVIVAVVDTGVRFTHPDLAGRLSANGYDFIALDTDPTDPDNGHGTHVAGTIGATTDNGVGVAGMTWVGQILPVRVLGTGGGTHFQFAQGFRYAAGLLAAPDPVNPTPAQVINYSGGGSDSQTKEDAVADVNDAGVIMACAAGNSNGAIDYPGAYSLDYPMVICVGATDFGNGSPSKALYSCFGPALNVMAPGGDTGVDSDSDGNVDGVLSTTWNFGTGLPTYSFWQGTSMATPHVAGLAALMLANDVPAASVRGRMQLTATDMGAPGFDNTYGYGLINAARALTGITNSWDMTYASMLQGSGDLDRLRTFRDRVLMSSPTGALYTRLLYRHSEEALAILNGQPQLMASAKDLLARNRTAVQTVLNGGEGTVDGVNEIVAFLDAFAAKSSPALAILARTAIREIRARQVTGETLFGFRVKERLRDRLR